jgi:RHS repeat-associated protein
MQDVDSGLTLLPFYDGNGNVVGMFDTATESVVGEYEYGPFGELMRSTGLTATFGFSTKYADAETALVYYGYRYYAPETGRWLSRDPIGEEGGVNVYGMVKNNPVNNWDRLGLYPGVPGHGYAISPADAVRLITLIQRDADNQFDRMSALFNSYQPDAMFPLSPAPSDRNKFRFQYIIGLFGGAALDTDSGNRFVYTCKYGWIDMGHFFRNAHGAYLGPDAAIAAGARGVDLWQYYMAGKLARGIGISPSLSGYAVEDLVSNQAGRVFGDGLSGNLAGAWERFLKDAGAVKWDSISRPLIELDQADYLRIDPMPVAKTPAGGLNWQKSQPLWNCLCDGDRPRLPQHRF